MFDLALRIDIYLSFIGNLFTEFVLSFRYISCLFGQQETKQSVLYGEALPVKCNENNIIKYIYI